MPQIMTMSGQQTLSAGQQILTAGQQTLSAGQQTLTAGQQTLSAAPLDLRTSTRGRGADSSPSDRGRARDSAEVKAESSVHQQDCMNGSRTSSPDHEYLELSPKMTPHLKAVSQNAPASTLPFRKRPYPSGSETDAQSSTVSAKEFTNGCKRSKLAISERKTNDNNDSKRRDAFGDSAQGIISGSRQLDPLMRHPCVLYPWPRSPHGVSGPRAHPSFRQVQECLHTDVAIATHQDDDGDTPLHIAVVQGHEEMVHRLIHILKSAKKDVDIYNNMRQTPLHLAVITGHVSLVWALLRAHADPAALDRHGQTALHLCCEYNHASCLSHVFSHSSGFTSSCLETRNYEGLSPLHLSVQNGNKEMVKLLLNNGADINGVDNKSGRSPLMHAVEANNMEMVNLLIEYVCDVNGQSYSGNTALHSACGRGHVEAVRTLLKNGADSSLKNYHNDTAVMVAKNKRVTDVLRGKGSRGLPPKSNDIESSVKSPQLNTPHPRQFSMNGSSSPQCIGCSPFTPKIQSPLGPAADSLSSRRSPVEVKETVLLHTNLGPHSVVRESPFPPHMPQSYPPIYPNFAQHLSVLMPPHLIYSTGLPGSPYHQEGPLRSSSRSSDQSDVSTMSVNSDNKGEISLD